MTPTQAKTLCSRPLEQILRKPKPKEICGSTRRQFADMSSFVRSHQLKRL